VLLSALSEEAPIRPNQKRGRHSFLRHAELASHVKVVSPIIEDMKPEIFDLLTSTVLARPYE
jgi:hypothetical protein